VLRPIRATPFDLSVCLCVCEQQNSKIYRWIFVKFGKRAEELIKFGMVMTGLGVKVKIKVSLSAL